MLNDDEIETRGDRGRINDSQPVVDGQTLRALRRSLGLGQGTLGSFVEVTRKGKPDFLDASYISKLESGKEDRRANPEYAFALQEAVRELCKKEEVEFKEFVSHTGAIIPSVRVEKSMRRFPRRGSKGSPRVAADIYKFAQAYREFRDDPTVRLVREMLEDGNSAAPEDRKDIRTLKAKSIVQALCSDSDDKKEEWENEVCQALDVFLEELQFFESYRRAGAISTKDLKFVGSVVCLLCGTGKTQDEDLLAQIWNYIDEGGFSNVRTLATRLGFEPPPPVDDQ